MMPCMEASAATTAVSVGTPGQAEHGHVRRLSPIWRSLAGPRARETIRAAGCPGQTPDATSPENHATGGGIPVRDLARAWVPSQGDGTPSPLDVANRSGIGGSAMTDAGDALAGTDLLRPAKDA